MYIYIYIHTYIHTYIQYYQNNICKALHVTKLSLYLSKFCLLIKYHRMKRVSAPS